MPSVRITIVLAAIALTTFGTASSAQMSLPRIDPMVMTTFARQDVLSQHLMRLERRQENDQQADAKAADKVSADFTFRSDPDRSRRNLQSFVTRTPGNEAKATLRQIIASDPDLIKTIGSGLASYGFDPSNFADTYAAWWINAWLASEKRNDDPNAATLQAVKEQVYQSFAETQVLVGADDAARQEFAEALMLQAVILGTIMEQASNDPAMREQLASVAKTGARASGLELSMMALTDKGFVAR